MQRKLTFCEECREDVQYDILPVDLKGTLKGQEYEYTGEKAVCSLCEGEVYVAEIEDWNLKALYDVYRLENSIISLEKIKQLPQKYDIGKRPLSLLLGWGEMTFTRYFDGDMPTKQYSEMLERVYNEPSYYESILEKNKGNLKSLSAYEKSKRKVEELLGERHVAESKLDLIIHYILHQCEDITPLALQKALYYIQGFYHAFEGDFIIEENCEAWLHGPVFRNVYNRYSSYRFDPIERVEEFDISVFTTAEKTIIDSVIKNFCCYSGKTLEAFTHMEEPWLRTRGGLPAQSHSDRIIEKELIGQYFKALKDKYNMLTPSDIECYSVERFEQIK